MKKRRIITANIIALSTGFVIFYASSPKYRALDSFGILSSSEHITIMSKESEISSADFSDYEVLSSYSSSSAGRHRETDIDIAVYGEQYNEELFKRIEDEHNRLNGEPETLTINLYRSNTDYVKGMKPYAVIYIDYANDIREITTISVYQ